MPHIMNDVKESDAEIKEQKFEHDCYLRIAIKIEKSPILQEHLQKYNSLKIEKIGTF